MLWAVPFQKLYRQLVRNCGGFGAAEVVGGGAAGFFGRELDALHRAAAQTLWACGYAGAKEGRDGSAAEKERMRMMMGLKVVATSVGKRARELRGSVQALGGQVRSLALSLAEWQVALLDATAAAAAAGGGGGGGGGRGVGLGLMR